MDTSGSATSDASAVEVCEPGLVAQLIAVVVVGTSHAHSGGNAVASELLQFGEIGRVGVAFDEARKQCGSVRIDHLVVCWNSGVSTWIHSSDDSVTELDCA